MRVYDSVPYQHDFTGSVSTTNMPDAGVHLSDTAVGALTALWRGGGITRDELIKRWPTTFDNAGKVYKVRRPMGDPYLMVSHEVQVVCGVTMGRTLACVAGYLKKS
jgi:hypothetical protein